MGELCYKHEGVMLQNMRVTNNDRGSCKAQVPHEKVYSPLLISVPFLHRSRE